VLVGARAGHADRYRVVAHHGVAAAGGGHHRAGVGGGDADEAGAGGGARVPAGGAEVERVPDGDRADAVLAGLGRGHRHGVVGGEHTERVAGVEHRDRAGVDQHLGVGAGADRALAEALHVHRDEVGAVRGEAAQVGVDQRPGDGGGRVRGHAGGREKPRHQGRQRLSGYEVGHVPPSVGRRARR
jgi:hypothetical protein